MKGAAAGPARSAGANPRMDPTPWDNLDKAPSGLASSGRTVSATLFITSRAEVSASSPKGATAPNAAISNV